MEIRRAEPEELEEILALYAEARDYMRAHGNPTQWGASYPGRALVERDIASGACHVCTEEGEILAVFSWLPGPDPTYAVIEDGSWADDGEYTVIHRIAVRAHRRGIASACFGWALARCRSLRIDTHADNLPMQRSLMKNGFSRCGVIHVENGSPRIAFQKVNP